MQVIIMMMLVIIMMMLVIIIMALMMTLTLPWYCNNNKWSWSKTVETSQNNSLGTKCPGKKFTIIIAVVVIIFIDIVNFAIRLQSLKSALKKNIMSSLSLSSALSSYVWVCDRLKAFQCIWRKSIIFIIIIDITIGSKFTPFGQSAPANNHHHPFIHSEDILTYRWTSKALQEKFVYGAEYILTFKLRACQCTWLWHFMRHELERALNHLYIWSQDKRRIAMMMWNTSNFQSKWIQTYHGPQGHHAIFDYIRHA